jgi:hypothetical protein
VRCPTLLELVVVCWDVAILAALLLPARQPQERGSLYDVVLLAVALLSAVLAVIGTVWLVVLLLVRWLRARFRDAERASPTDSDA